MSYFNVEDLEEVVHFADHFLLESGVHRGKTPEIYASPHKLGGTSVDYIPETDTLVFRGAGDQDIFEVEEDTVKLLAKIYSGIKDDYSWDSGAYFKLESSLEDLPDTWELPIRETGTDTEVNEYVLGSELWKRRSDNLLPLIEETEERVEELQEIYDEKVRPVEELDMEMTPEQDEDAVVDTEVYEYFNSDLKNVFVENVKAGDREVFEEYTEERIDEIYDQVEDEETADQLINEIDENLPELRRISREMREQEEKVTEKIRYEIGQMLDQQEPRPEEKAVAYMVPLLVHGRLDSHKMHSDNLDYIESIAENSQEVQQYATEIYQAYLNTESDARPQERFAEAIEQTEIPY
ncbi:MAG: hypothetical protein ABEK10_02690 [Candidatus Nanosalina sp.]